jgi:hypothetical protein
MGLIGARVGDTWRELRGDAEDAVDEFALSYRIAMVKGEVPLRHDLLQVAIRE